MHSLLKPIFLIFFSIFQMIGAFAQPKFSKCKSADIFLLNKSVLKRDFIAKIKAKRANKKELYPTIFFDLNEKWLTTFLQDIDRIKFIKKNSFEKTYHFNVAPKPYTDSNECKDNIRIDYNNKNCIFTINVLNSFFAGGWCTEHNVFYSFKIINNKIVNLKITEAG